MTQNLKAADLRRNVPRLLFKHSVKLYVFALPRPERPAYTPQPPWSGVQGLPALLRLLIPQNSQIAAA